MNRSNGCIGIGVMCCAILSAQLSAEAAGFAQKPAAAAVGEGAKIGFALNGPGDVEVAILDAKGHEVRHLAAGLVGSKEAAPPLTPDALVQTLTWDGRDDLGKTIQATARPFSARVRLGMLLNDARVIADESDKPPAATREPDAKWVPKTPYEAGRSGLSAKEAGTKEGRRLLSNRWTLEADKETDLCYILDDNGRYGGGDTGTTRRYNGSTGAMGKPPPMPKAKGLIFRFSVGVNGDLIAGPYVRYTREGKEVPPPEGMITHENILSQNYGFLPYQRARPIHEYWSGTKGFEGLDGRAYLRVGYNMPYQRVTIWDTWENKRVMRDGFQKLVSNSKGRGHASCTRADTAGYFYLSMYGGPRAGNRPEKTPGVNGGYGTILKLDLNKRWAKDITYPFAGKPSDPEEARTAVEWFPIDGEYLTQYEKIYPYVISPIPGGCNCKGPHFDLDEYGRLYIPDSLEGLVRVLDNAGNPICVVKDKVSADAGGQGTALFVGSPFRLACSRQALYIADPVNNRVLRLALNWQATESCPIK